MIVGIYDKFRFLPAPWLSHSDLPLEEPERVRNSKREDMDYTNGNEGTSYMSEAMAKPFGSWRCGQSMGDL